MRSPTEPTPFVSVIVPVYRNPDGLKTCLDALASQTYPQTHFEVVVIDNGENGNLEPLASVYGNLVLGHEAVPGSYAARNKGLSLARGTVVAFTDSDCIPAPDWLSAGVKALSREPRPDIIGGRVEVVGREAQALGIFETYQVVNGFYPEAGIREGRGTTANLMTRRALFEEIGPFRSEFQSGADAEWTLRAVKRGLTLVYAPEPIVQHPARHAFLDFSLRYVRTTGGRFAWSHATGIPPLSLSTALRYLRPPFGETWRNREHPALQARFGAAKFFVAAYWVRAIRLVESVRLLLGGQAIRY